MDLLIAISPTLTIVAIWIAFSLYSGNKINNHRKNLVPVSERPHSSLTLTRGIEPTNYFRKYRVFVDGNEVEAISSGETKHFLLSPGKHTVKVQIDWASCTLVEFEISGTGNTELHCGASYNDWRCVFMGFINPSKWIYLRSV